MRFNLSTTALAAAFAIAACGPAGAQGTGGSPGHMGAMKGGAMIANPHQLSVPLKEQNGSGESGTAMLKDTPGGLSVVLSLHGGTAAPQPAHIHKGYCPKIDPKPEYALSPVVEGKSTTMIKGVTIAMLLKTKNAINVHESAKNLPKYVACGSIINLTAHGAM
jgi:hypothetical protein